MSNFLETKRQNIESVLRVLEPGTPLEPASNLPLLLHLEITTRCNLRCLKCGHATDPPGTSRITPRNLPYAIIETFDEYFAAAIRVHTFGYGEMFLYAKLKRLVERLKHFGCAVDGITNGVLVDKEEVDWLVDYGYDQITFSIDGVEPETMQRLRGVDIEKIWQALAYLKQRKQECGKDRPHVIVNFVAQSDNYHELPGLVRKLSDLNIAFLGVNPLMPAELDAKDNYARLHREFGLHSVPREKLEAALDEAGRLAAEARIGFTYFIDLNALYERRYVSDMGDTLLQILPQDRLTRVQENNKLQPYYCSYPWTSIYVNSDNTTKICCFMDDNFGAARDADELNKIWNGESITRIREAISKGEIHPSCRSCVQLGRYQHSYVELKELQDDFARLAAESEDAGGPAASAEQPQEPQVPLSLVLLG